MLILDADGLTGEERAEIDFLVAQADTSAMDDYDGFVVEGIIDAGQCGVMVDRLLPDIIMPRTSCGRSLLKISRNLSKRAGCYRKFITAGPVEISLNFNFRR